MGSEMCIRDSIFGIDQDQAHTGSDFSATLVEFPRIILEFCLLYTSDAADERSSVDLGGRRIIKKKKHAERHIWRNATKIRHDERTARGSCSQRTDEK